MNEDQSSKIYFVLFFLRCLEDRSMNDNIVDDTFGFKYIITLPSCDLNHTISSHT